MKKSNVTLMAAISIAMAFTLSCSSDSDDGGGGNKQKLAEELCTKRYDEGYGGVFTNPTTGKTTDCPEYYTDACTQKGIQQLIKIEDSCKSPTTSAEYIEWLKCRSEQNAEYDKVIKSECPTLAID